MNDMPGGQLNKKKGIIRVALVGRERDKVERTAAVVS